MSGTLFAFSSHYSVGQPNGYGDALSVYAGRTGMWALRDRFGFLNRFSPYRLYEPHETFPGGGRADRLPDLMGARAEELVARSRREERDLYLFVSGGVDSTAMTIALLEAAGEDRSRLHVIGTRHSEREYPAFMDFLRSLKDLDMREAPPCVGLAAAQDEAMRTGYAVTGWCADQLFGSIVNQMYPTEHYHSDWRGWLKGEDDAVQQLEAAFAHYGLPVKTFGEFAWFMNFACKYDYVKHTDTLLSGNVTGRMIPFYDTPEFQAWSVSNFDMLHRLPQTRAACYKRPLKEYIFAFNGDRQYLWGKGKEGSWGRLEDGDGEDASRHPVMAVAMESPDSARVERTGEYLREGVDARTPDDELRRGMLRSYLKDTEGRFQA